MRKMVSVGTNAYALAYFLIRSYAQNFLFASRQAFSVVFALVCSPKTPLTEEIIPSVPSQRLPYCLSRAHSSHVLPWYSATSLARRILPLALFEASSLGGMALSVPCISNRLNKSSTSNFPSPQNLSTAIKSFVKGLALITTSIHLFFLVPYLICRYSPALCILIPVPSVLTLQKPFFGSSNLRSSARIRRLIVE